MRSKWENRTRKNFFLRWWRKIHLLCQKLKNNNKYKTKVHVIRIYKELYDHWKEIIKHWLFFSLSMQRHLFHVIHVSAPCNTFISLFILSLRARILHNAVIEFARRIQHKVTNLKLFRNYFHSKWDTKSPYKGVTRHISVDRQLPRQRWWLIWDDGQRGCIE